MNYIIKRGDTLSKIAASFMNHSSGDYFALAKTNNIINPNKIYVGQTIYIPDAWLRKNVTDINKTNNVTDINPFNNAVKKPSAWMTEALKRSDDIYAMYSNGKRPDENMVIGTKSGQLMTRESAISSGEFPADKTLSNKTMFLLGVGAALFYILMGNKKAPRTRRRYINKK